jgi:hypothetical protein
VQDVTRILAVPVVSMFVIIFLYIGWVASACFLYSIGEKKFDTTSNIYFFKWDDTTRYLWYFFFFGLLWLNAFILAMTQFVIIVAASMWYFGRSSDAKADVSLCTGVKWGLWYHCGSLAFGSLILAIVWLIKLVFEYMRVRKIYLCFRKNSLVQPQQTQLVSLNASCVAAHVSLTALTDLSNTSTEMHTSKSASLQRTFALVHGNLLPSCLKTWLNLP